MRSLGPGLILSGALATLAAMFLPATSFGGESLTWWEWVSGLDIALLAVCVVAAGLALAAVIAGHPTVRQLAGIAAAVAFGLAFAPVPGAIHDSQAARGGLWIVAATGTIALAGAAVTTVLPPRGREARLGWIAVAFVGVVAVVALAVGDPFGDDDFQPTAVAEETDFELLDAADASAFAQRWARQRTRPGERPEAGCALDATSWPPRFECDIRYRHAPPGYKVIRRRSSELHIVAVRPEVAYYRQDGKPDGARDQGRRNRWRVIDVISLGGESK
jgi:hypothetical protein